jgi:hypothetical protein
MKAMDPKLIRELLAGQEDVLTPEIEAEEALYKNLRCPMCAEGDCEKKLYQPKVVEGEDGEPVVVQSPFSSGSLLPEGYAHCIHCGTDFDPYTRVIFSTEASMIHGPD